MVWGKKTPAKLEIEDKMNAYHLHSFCTFVIIVNCICICKLVCDGNWEIIVDFCDCYVWNYVECVVAHVHLKWHFRFFKSLTDNPRNV